MKTAKEIMNELNNNRAIKWEGLSDGGKWSRAIVAMEEYASQFNSNQQNQKNNKSNIPRERKG